MASEHDSLSRLPEPPAPSPARRRAAIANALDAFEKKYRTRFQASSASPASHAADGHPAVAQESRHAACTPPHCRQPRRPDGRIGRMALPRRIRRTTCRPATTHAQSRPAQPHEDRRTTGAVEHQPEHGHRLGLCAAIGGTRTGDRWARTAEGAATRGRSAPGCAHATGCGPRRAVMPTALRLSALHRRSRCRRPSRSGATGSSAPPRTPSRRCARAPVSTFSIDVDTASYSFVRASLNRNVLPQPAAVRDRGDDQLFPLCLCGARVGERAVPARRSRCFRARGRRAARSSRSASRATRCRPRPRPRANLVFLIDTSGSMDAPNRLPLVKQSLAMLLDAAAAERPGRDRHLCRQRRHRARADRRRPRRRRSSRALERLEAGGSTAGAEGIRQAYALAEQNFDPNGVNRVILATDGDFNVGITRPRRAQGLRRAPARQGHLPLRSSASAWATTTTR